MVSGIGRFLVNH